MAGSPFTAAIFRWLDRVAADPDIPAAAFRLAYVISQHINRTNHQAWPSQETLRDAIGLKGQDGRSVRRLATTLVDRGYLLMRRGRRVSMTYKLALDRSEMTYQASVEDGQPDAVRPDENDRSGVQDRTFDDVRPDNSDRQDRSNLTAKPLIEPLIESESGTRARAKVVPENFSLDDQTHNWALEHLGSADAVTASLSRFRDHHRGKGAVSHDWQATARLWIGDDVRSGRYRTVAPIQSGQGAGPTEAAWRGVLTTFVQSKGSRWTMYATEFGPPPGSPGCRVPAHLLEEFGLARPAA